MGKNPFFESARTRMRKRDSGFLFMGPMLGVEDPESHTVATQFSVFFPASIRLVAGWADSVF
jgi:hypothetical protein